MRPIETQIVGGRTPSRFAGAPPAMSTSCPIRSQPPQRVPYRSAPRALAGCVPTNGRRAGSRPAGIEAADRLGGALAYQGADHALWAPARRAHTCSLHHDSCTSITQLMRQSIVERQQSLDIVEPQGQPVHDLVDLLARDRQRRRHQDLVAGDTVRAGARVDHEAMLLSSQVRLAT